LKCLNSGKNELKNLGEKGNLQNDMKTLSENTTLSSFELLFYISRQKMIMNI